MVKGFEVAKDTGKKPYTSFAMKTERKNLLKASAAAAACMLMVLITSAAASPTVDNQMLCFAGEPLIPATYSTVKGFECPDTSLAAIGRKITLLSTDRQYRPDSHKTDAISLPAVPASVLLVLTGFLCVSLVRDRKVWLGLLATLLWASQGGVRAVPRLAGYLNRGTSVNRLKTTKPLNLCSFENSSRTRPDLDGAGYIGLLRHLNGIPEAKATAERLYKLSIPDIFVQNRHFFHRPQPAAKPSYSLPITASNRFVSIIKQRCYFRPRITFSNLSRGPPAFVGCDTVFLHR